MTARVLGIDTSTHNGLFNYALAKTKGVKWVIAKGSDVGSVTNRGFVDNQLDNSFRNAKAEGLLVGAYHWMDARRDALYQANYYLDNVWGKYNFDFPPVLDVEEPEGRESPEKKRWYMREALRWLEIVETQTGRRPIVYTAQWYTNAFNSQDYVWMRNYPIWVAYYVHATQPRLPIGVDRYAIWQYSSNASYPHYTPSGGNARSWGSGSDGLDTNWFNGSYADLLAFLKVDNEQPPVEEPPVEIETPLYRAKVNATLGLRVRSTPVYMANNANRLYVLPHNTVVDVYDLNNGFSKIKPDKSEWASSTYLTRLHEDPLPEPEVLYRARVKASATPYLLIRKGAGTENPYWRRPDGTPMRLMPLEEFDVYVETSQWLKISKDENKWVAKVYTEKVYMPEPPETPEVGELEYLYLPFDESKGFRISQYFGSNPNWYPRARGHNGIDWALLPWNKLYAARGGRVIRADYNGDGYGRSLWIQTYDSNGNKSGVLIYGHMKTFAVKVGDIVVDKQYIGTSDGELSDPYRGFSTGSHLHFELRLEEPIPSPQPGNYVYNATDPLPLMVSWDYDPNNELQKLYDAKVTANVLNVRVAPSINSNTYGGTYLRKDTRIEVYDEKDGWARISPRLHKWVSTQWINKI